MRTKIPILVVVCLCALVGAGYVNAADDPAALLKQADTHRTNKQYDQAEQLYLALAKQNTPEAFTAQKHLTFLYIAQTPPKLDLAEAAYQQLLSRFAKNDGLSQAIYEIGRRYDKINQANKALQLHESNVERYPNDLHGMYSQVEIIKSRIAARSQSEADAAVEKLLTVFAEQPTLPREVYQLGLGYDKGGRSDRARALYRHVLDHWPQSPHAPWPELALLDGQKLPESAPAVQEALARLIKALPEQGLRATDLYRAAQDFGKTRPRRALALHQYNVEHSPKDDLRTMWSQTELAKAYIRDGNDVAADAAVNGLLTAFAKQETLPTEVCRIADTYLEVGRYEKGESLYQSVLQQRPDPNQVLWARAGEIKLSIAQGKDADISKRIDTLIADFNSRADLAQAVLEIGEVYYMQAGREQQVARQKSPPAAGTPAPKAVPLYQKAIGVWQIVLERLPEDPKATPTASRLIADCYYQSAEYIKAMEQHVYFLEHWPNHQDAWREEQQIVQMFRVMMKAGILSRQEGFAEIERVFEQILDRNPTCPVAPDIRKWLARYGTAAKGGAQ